MRWRVEKGDVLGWTPFSNEYFAEDIYDKIEDAIQLPSESYKPFAYLGIVTDFNVIEIEQS